MNNTPDKLTFDEVISHFGQPVKTISDESEWQCPYCKDTGKDNLKYNHKKQILTCFANQEHGHEIFKNIKNNVKEVNFKSKTKKPVQEKSKASIDMEYALKCEYELMNNQKAQDYIFKKRGLTYETCSFMGIGIDRDKKCWVFPAFNPDYELIGAEYRPGDLSKKGLHKAAGTYAELCPVNCIEDAKNLIITEGFIDAYTLWQHFNESGESSDWQIMTPSNGVNTLPNLVNRIIPSKYDRIVFYLDDDEAGHSAIKQITEKVKFNFEIKFNTCQCCKDFNDIYLKHIRK